MTHALRPKVARPRRTAHRLQQILFGRLRAVDHTVVLVAAIVIGVLAGCGAIGYRVLLGWSHQLFFPTTEYSLALLEQMPWWKRLLLPCAGGLLVGAVT